MVYFVEKTKIVQQRTNDETHTHTRAHKMCTTHTDNTLYEDGASVVSVYVCLSNTRHTCS